VDVYSLRLPASEELLNHGVKQLLWRVLRLLRSSMCDI
jgi:hypothetical protein